LKVFPVEVYCDEISPSFLTSHSCTIFFQGLLASKAVGVDGAERKEDCSATAPVLEQV
jgi:hypothetical protein